MRPVLLVLNLVALVTFIYMANNDTAKHREYFFYVFSIYMVVLYLNLLYKAYSASQDEKVIEQIC